MRFSGDGSYVLSGSDDTNIRLWKAQASQQLGVVSAQLSTCNHEKRAMSTADSAAGDSPVGGGSQLFVAQQLGVASAQLPYLYAH